MYDESYTFMLIQIPDVSRLSTTFEISMTAEKCLKRIKIWYTVHAGENETCITFGMWEQLGANQCDQ